MPENEYQEPTGSLTGLTMDDLTLLELSLECKIAGEEAFLENLSPQASREWSESMIDRLTRLIEQVITEWQRLEALEDSHE